MTPHTTGLLSSGASSAVRRRMLLGKKRVRDPERGFLPPLPKQIQAIFARHDLNEIRAKYLQPDKVDEVSLPSLTTSEGTTRTSTLRTKTIKRVKCLVKEKEVVCSFPSITRAFQQTAIFRALSRRSQRLRHTATMSDDDSMGSSLPSLAQSSKDASSFMSEFAACLRPKELFLQE
jgi:hypothetical protein